MLMWQLHPLAAYSNFIQFRLTETYKRISLKPGHYINNVCVRKKKYVFFLPTKVHISRPWPYTHTVKHPTKPASLYTLFIPPPIHTHTKAYQHPSLIKASRNKGGNWSFSRGHYHPLGVKSQHPHLSHLSLEKQIKRGVIRNCSRLLLCHPRLQLRALSWWKLSQDNF